MKKLLIIALTAVASLCTHAKMTVNVTPLPARMTVGNDSLRLTHGFNVGYDASLPAPLQAEAVKFVNALNASTSLDATAKPGRGLITVSLDKTLPAEGYTLTVTPRGAQLKASTATGLFYGFQTVKKLLPPYVAAGKQPCAVSPDGLFLPEVAIVDAPKMEYRGFMLDVSRHFFDADQLKKMLDIMAVYKLNRFHWHLTDDQGWRLPVDKYPNLTQEGATNRNILRTDFSAQKQWRAGEDSIYGPYAYTTDEVRDIVAYAKDRHIEVIPEIDMPGHMVAAIHAYPELSVDPESKLVEAGVHPDFSHAIWNKGGVSRDVLDVSNPKVMQFVHDVVDVLADLFPYEYIHLGGDECPTLAWENSDACQAKMKELGLTSVRQLQSWFTKEVADYAAAKHGKKVCAWNELITEHNADMDLVKQIDPIVFCWIGGEQKSQANGLKHVYTPFNGGYYINRSYSGHDRVGACGDGALSLAYNVCPPSNDLCIGVQGTFWTEQVDRYQDLEYLALPRLIALAEQGWTPDSRRDYDDFLDRIYADQELLDAAGLNYGKHQLVRSSDYVKPDPDRWYRLASVAADEDRMGRTIELLAPDSPILADHLLQGASQGRLWSVRPQGPATDWQLFRFVENPDRPGHYAIVCKAMPQGSLCATPTGTNVNDRWTYHPSTLAYDFEFDKGYHSVAGDEIRYAIRPVGTQNYLNFGLARQGNAINVYARPGEGQGGVIAFIPE